MPERPLLILPSPGEPLPRRRRGGGGGAPHLPGRDRQTERLDPKFDALQEALEARRVRVQAESHDLVPEEVIVLETVDTVEHFIRAVEKVPGMEWLAEIEETDIPPDDDLATGGNEPARLGIYSGTLAPGHRVAAPGSTAGDLAAAKYTRGTSNAAALISRAAGSLYEVLEELRNDPGGELIDVVPRAVWLKALIAHGADWGTVAETLRTVLGGDDKVPFRERATRLLGYGAVDTNRVRECTGSRVTTLGAGLLKEDESHEHRFPLAPSLSGWRGHRRLTISLAWLSPVNPRHRGWRRAQL